MKDVLKGKTILIGKEPGQGRLLIAIKGLPKIITIGQIGSVPESVSRCKPAEGVAHCQLEIDEVGNLTLTNLKAQNVTLVNNGEIMSKRVNTASTVLLGKDRYPIDLSVILDAAEKLFVTVVPPTQPKFSIKHLKDVWDEYNENQKKIKIRQKNIGLLSSIPIAFSMFGGLLAGVAPEIRSFALVFTGIALVIMFIGLYLRFTDKSIEKSEQEQEKLQNKYVCPNPKCRHFLGIQSYNILKQNKGCPHCKCLWTTEE